MSLLVDKVKAELRREGLKLWVAPYTPPEDGALSNLAAIYAGRLSVDAIEVGSVLEELRLHALSKLQAKANTRMQASLPTQECSSLPEGLTLQCKVVGGKVSTWEFVFEVSVSDSGASVRRGLCEKVAVSELKVIAGGRSLQDDYTLKEQDWRADHERGGRPLRVLLLVSQAQPSSEGHSASGAEPPSSSSEEDCSVTHIRLAAEQLTAKGFGDFELSDANTGRLVPIPAGARQPLVTAIALHARGQELLGGGNSEKSVARALEFLVEADGCFERCRSAGASELLDKLGNFGQLQLDVCWAYALLGDSSHLPDAEARLGAVERMISRQVDKNFLTLAEVRAEQGRTLPPDVLPSVRLWLLRGIAKSCRGKEHEAREDLERARLFMQALRVDEEAVNNLLLLGASRVEAVAALRRCEGSPDRAAGDLLSSAAQRKAARAERAAQKRYGQTANGSFVDPDRVAQLRAMGIEEASAVEALKTADNELDSALDAVERKRSKKGHASEEVDDLAMATLMSMGVDRDVAETALRSVGGSDVARALERATASQEATPIENLSREEASSKVNGDEQAEKCTAAEQKPTDEEEEEKVKRAEAERAAHEAALQLVEREMGQCLRRRDLEDDIAGASLEEEELLLRRYLS